MRLRSKLIYISILLSIYLLIYIISYLFLDSPVKLIFFLLRNSLVPLKIPLNKAVDTLTDQMQLL